MKTLPSRRALIGVASTVLALVAAPLAHAQLIYGEIVASPVAQGSYVHWAPIYTNEHPGAFERSSTFTVGEGWTHAVQNVNHFDVHRAFLVFNLPNFGRPITREEGGIPDGVRPEIDLMRAELISVWLSFPATSFFNTPIEPFDFRLTALPASALIDGTIDPATAFHGLAQGLDIGPSVIDGQYYATEEPSDVQFNQAFFDLFNAGVSGPLVLSFSLPNSLRSYPIVTYAGDFTLKLGYLGYEPITPVPEPSTYALAGLVLCAGAVAFRRRRRGPPAAILPKT